jgi:hypothetical protein
MMGTSRVRRTIRLVRGLLAFLLVGGTTFVGSPALANGCGLPFIGTTYQLSLPTHFANIWRCDPTWNYSVVSDIDLTGVNITYLDDFVGTFDGNHRIISNMTVTAGGLFDVGAAGATFTRLDLRNANVSGSGPNGWSGALIREASGPVTITFSSVTNAVIQSLLGGNAFAGGFIGNAYHDVMIADSYVTGTVTGGADGNGWVGGFIGNSTTNVPGLARSVTIQRSFFNGAIQGGTAGNTWAAGMVGSITSLDNTFATTDSYVLASVNSGSGGNGFARGFLGQGVGFLPRSLDRSYFQGTLQDQGLNIARAFGAGPVNGSFCVTTCNDLGTNATVEQLQTESFIAAAGWNVSSVWCISAGGGGPSLKSITFGPNPTQCVSPPATVAPIIPAYRSTITFGDGTCTMHGEVLPASSFFLGYRYLPGVSECTRPGYTFTGWARTTAPTIPVDLPLLIDPSDGVQRYFVAGDADLVAIWTKNPEPKAPTIFVALNGFFCRNCGNWLIWNKADNATQVTVTSGTRTVCTTLKITIDQWTLCHDPQPPRGPNTYTLTATNETTTSPPITATTPR